MNKTLAIVMTPIDMTKDPRLIAREAKQQSRDFQMPVALQYNNRSYIITAGDSITDICKMIQSKIKTDTY